MSELIADLFVSVDGCAKGSRSPAYFGFGGDAGLRTIGSLPLVSQLLGAGLVDRLRLLVFPLIAGETGQEPAFARLPDIGLDLVGQSVRDGRIVLSEYRPSGVPPYAS